MLSRRNFIQGTVTLAAGTAVGDIAFPEREIKEHGIVEIRFKFLSCKPIVVPSTIFSDERRGVFGMRLLDKREPGDVRLAEFCLADVIGAVAAPGRVRKCAVTAWKGNGMKENSFLDLMVKDGNLMFAALGQIEESPPWMSMVDVRQVL
jgi:hypothetical protein